MRFGIDGRMYSESGVGRYIRNLIAELQVLDNRNEYYIFLLKKDYNSLTYHSGNFKKVVADFKWYGFEEQIKFPPLLRKYNLDLVHFPHFSVPIFYKEKFVVTIHDLIHQKFSMQRVTTHGPILYKVKQLGYKKVFGDAIKRSEKILVPSNFVKNQLINKWWVKAEKIMVSHEAVEGQIIAIATHCTQNKIDQVLKKFKINGSYIFYVGNAHPHKNVEGLIAAFRQLKVKSQKSKVKNNDLKLILAGQDHYFWERIKKELQESRVRSPEDIIFTGHVSDEEMVALYKSAECFVMPSLEEGFGIPILEAMACSCPVVSSNGGSLPEVGGDACIYFDPHNIDDMAEKISLLCHPERNEGSNELRQQLIEKGQKRYKEFSWKKLAEKTLEIYKS